MHRKIVMPQHKRESLLHGTACQSMTIRCAEFLAKFNTVCAPQYSMKSN